MSKPKINVIDLDKTLVPFDTFRVLIKREIIKGKWTIIYFTILRSTRLISASIFKMQVHKYLVNTYPTSFFADYAKEIYQQINPEVMEIIKSLTDKETTNILLSASPDEYVKKLCELLYWKGMGSYYDENVKFFHLHGNEKIKWIKFNYPLEKYSYNFAISDSDSDSELLNLFRTKIYWK